jgi:hypothetical protein
MTAPSIAALTERLLKLSPLEFETFVYKLVLELPSAKDVRRNSRVGGIEIDTQATLNGQMVVFEVKRLVTFPVNRAEAFAAFAKRAKEVTGAQRVILVAPARYSPPFLQVLQDNGIECWGIEELARQTTEDLWKWIDSAGTDLSSEPAQNKAESLAAALGAIPAGNVEALDFQKLWLDAAEFLFTPPLGVRRDIIMENFAESGFWAVARSEYVARYIVIDAKNYEDAIGKRCILDVAHYLKQHGCGLFALLTTRAGAKDSAMHAIREHWIAERKMILVLNDNDLKRMLTLRADGADPSIVIRETLRTFIFSM